MTSFSFCNCIIIIVVVVITLNNGKLLIIVCLIIFLGGQICNLWGKKIDYQYQIIFLISLVNHCWATIDMTFCFFADFLHMEWVCFDSAYIYERIEITNVFKKRDHDHILYTSKR